MWLQYEDRKVNLQYRRQRIAKQDKHVEYRVVVHFRQANTQGFALHVNDNLLNETVNVVISQSGPICGRKRGEIESATP